MLDWRNYWTIFSKTSIDQIIKISLWCTFHKSCCISRLILHNSLMCQQVMIKMKQILVSVTWKFHSKVLNFLSFQIKLNNISKLIKLITWIHGKKKLKMKSSKKIYLLATKRKFMKLLTLTVIFNKWSLAKRFWNIKKTK